MAKRIIDTPLLMTPIAHFSHAVRLGTTLHAGAIAGTDAARRLAGDTPGLVDAVAQTQRMYDNLETTLALLDATVDDLVRLKVYVTDPRDIARCDAVFRERYPRLGVTPTIVGSHGFPLPQAAIELDAVAHPGAASRTAVAVAPGCGGVRAGDSLHLNVCSDAAAGADAADQCASLLARLEALLAHAAMTPRDVVNLHLTVADIRDAAIFDSALGRAYPAPYPSATVVAAPLPDPAMRFQLEVVAIEGGGRPLSIDDGATALDNASDAMLAGDVLYVSAQSGACGTHTPADGAGNVQTQTLRAWARVTALLAAAGLGIEHVLRTNNVLTDWRHYAGFNAGYGASTRRPYPNRATVLGGLSDPRACVHVEAIAHRDALASTVVEANGHERA